MTKRIPPGMPIHTWVDRLIAEAAERGEFENLPGAGKPLPGLDRPLDEDWWVKQKIAEEEVPGDALLPPALALRKEVRALPQRVRDLPDEASVRAVVSDVNQRVADWIRAPSGPVLPIAPADTEDIVDQWRKARAGTGKPPTSHTGASEHTAASGQRPEGDDGAATPEPGPSSPRRRPWWRRSGERRR